MGNDFFYLIFEQANKYTLLDKFMILGAGPLIYIALIISLILALKAGAPERKAFLYILLSVPLVILIIKGVHLFYFTDRPFINLNIKPLIDPFYGVASFPSRHTAIAAAIFLSFLFNRSKWSMFFLVITAWVGVARIFVGVHYPIDILGGILVGGVSVIILKLFQKKLSI